MIDVALSTTCLGSFDEHDRDRSMFQAEFRRRLLAEPGIHRRVLDIGCGPELPAALEDLRPVMTNLDGLDPMRGVAARHSLLKNRWDVPFETSDVPDATYDLAYAYNVVEHIADPMPFFRKVRKILKPDGVFWALTPHGKHPFARIVRVVQAMKLKKGVAARNRNVNDYPAYYRLNSAGVVKAAARECGFRSVELVYMPCVQWDMYFPRSLRWMPHAYDRVLGLKYRPFMLLMAYRLQ